MILDEIVEEKKKQIEELKKPGISLKDRLTEEELTLISEIKKASPSRGIICDEFNPLGCLEEYHRGGADAISVLTDEKYFQGGNDIFRQVRENTTLPLLRKEFIISPVQVYESKFLGADVILLIVAILSREQLRELLRLAGEFGLEAIVEVHSKQELKIATSLPAEIIGINNRNLKDFTVDLETTGRMLDHLEAEGIRENYCIIAESGIGGPEDIKYLNRAGADGVLIGTELMKSERPARRIRELFAGIKEVK
ncbi:MAG: indole-3-glycerol phosphate synthase TrpC [Bacillota bacterium]